MYDNRSKENKKHFDKEKLLKNCAYVNNTNYMNNMCSIFKSIF